MSRKQHVHLILDRMKDLLNGCDEFEFDIASGKDIACNIEEGQENGTYTITIKINGGASDRHYTKPLD